jgi:hypothetical protein
VSATTALAIVMASWLAIGVVTGSIMGWGGHDWFTWWLLGVVLGRLVIPLAVALGGRGGGGTRRLVLRGRPDGAPDHVRSAGREPARPGRNAGLAGSLRVPVPLGSLAVRATALLPRQEAHWQPR